MFKPKTAAPDKAPGIDYAAVQALQDQAQAALKINEPVARLLAVNAAIDNIEAARDDNRFCYEGIKGPLGPAARARLDQYEAQVEIVAKTFNRRLVLGALVAGLGACGLAVFTGGGIVLGIALAVPAGGLGVIGSLMTDLAHLSLGEKLAIRALRKLMPETNPLRATLTTLTEAAADIEKTLTLAEARQSADFNRLLDLSPSLEERFTKEAQRAATFGDAKPAAAAAEAPIPKPIRRDIAV